MIPISIGTKHKDADISTQHKPRYRYSGKEEQLETMSGILDFGSRYYNPQIGRWLHPDPQAESYYQYSSYTYCANNPTNLIDPDGERIVVTNYFNNSGQSFNFYEWTNETGKWQFVDFFTRKPYIMGTDAYFDALTQAFERMMSNSYDKFRIEELSRNNIEHSLVLEGKIHTEYTIVDATYALLHELTHFYDDVQKKRM